MSTLDRRTFLKGTLYGLLGAVLGWEIEAIAATEAAPAEEERAVASGTVPWSALVGPCWDCGVRFSYECDNCDEFSEWTPILKGDGLDAVRWAGAPPPDIYVGVGDGGRALVSVNGKEPYWCNSLNDPLNQLYHDFAVAQARAIDREIMSLQGDKE